VGGAQGLCFWDAHEKVERRQRGHTEPEPGSCAEDASSCHNRLCDDCLPELLARQAASRMLQNAAARR
jgi:hypothetical protein